MNILGLIPLAIFVLCCALIVWVLAQLARQGDERAPRGGWTRF